jgi:hypothetical protein
LSLFAGAHWLRKSALNDLIQMSPKLETVFDPTRLVEYSLVRGFAVKEGGGDFVTRLSFRIRFLEPELEDSAARRLDITLASLDTVQNLPLERV